MTASCAYEMSWGLLEATGGGKSTEEEVQWVLTTLLEGKKKNVLKNKNLLNGSVQLSKR